MFISNNQKIYAIKLDGDYIRPFSFRFCGRKSAISRELSLSYSCMWLNRYSIHFFGSTFANLQHHALSAYQEIDVDACCIDLVYRLTIVRSFFPCTTFVGQYMEVEKKKPAHIGASLWHMALVPDPGYYHSSPFGYSYWRLFLQSKKKYP